MNERYCDLCASALHAASDLALIEDVPEGLERPAHQQRVELCGACVDRFFAWFAEQSGEAQ